MSKEEFNASDLSQAMAPIDKVLDAFSRELSSASKDKDCDNGGQSDFALRVHCLWNNNMGPSKRYLRNLVRQFIRRLEAEGTVIEDENLLMLILKCSQSSDLFPDPSETGYQTFRILSDVNDEPLRIRVFPQHNDVSLRLWEAGGVLAEYLIQYPFYVAGKVVLETGAGVGLTALVAARYCGAAKVLATDYSVECLHNLAHNININQSWLNKACTSPDLSKGFLDWNTYAAVDCDKQLATCSTFQVFQVADVLLAADVVYDANAIPILVKLVVKFLSSGRTGRIAIFATTLRNQATFARFQAELGNNKVQCHYDDGSTIENLPKIFPIYNVQPRSDIRICKMTWEKNWTSG